MDLRCQSDDTPKYENIRNIPFQIRNETKMSAMTTSIQYHTKGLSQCNRITENRLHRER